MPAIACQSHRTASRNLRALAIWAALSAALISSWQFSLQAALADEWRPIAERTSTLEAKLLADMADGKLDQFSLAAACLIAVGHEDPTAIASAEAKVAVFQREVAQLCQSDTAPLDKAKRAFQFMHGKVLTGKYQAEQHDLQALLETGDYNCLTATLLFRLITAELNAKVAGMTAPGHVWIQIHFDRDAGETLEIESTSPEWTRPEIKLPGRKLSDVQLIAKVYYNRGAEALQRKDFAAAVRLARMGLLLDPADQYARMNMLAAMNNWAIGLADERRYAEAATLLAEGFRQSPEYAPFAANQGYVVSRWAGDLAGEGRWRELAELPGIIAGL